MSARYDEARQGLLEEEVGSSPVLHYTSTPPRCRTPSLPGKPLRRVLLAVLALAAVLGICYLTAEGGSTDAHDASYRDTFHLPPLEPLDPEKTLVQLPTAEHTVTAIILHGLGDTFHTLPFPAVLAERYNYVKWVAPQARLLNSTVNGEVPTSAWYNIETFADLHQNEDEEGMIESQRQINQLIAEEQQALIRLDREPRIVLAGFSQGAVMTMLNVLSSTHELEVAILLSGYLALPDQTQQLASTIPRDLPVRWGHGRADPFLTVEHASEDVETLQLPPYSLNGLEYKIYDHLEHYWSAEETEDMAAWFGQHVPRHRLAEQRRGGARPVGRRRHFKG